MSEQSIADLRREYSREGLRRADLAADPLAQFTRWFDDARQAEILDPTAMTLATCDASGTPMARIVLLKAFDARGFVFYTNHQGGKAAELADNPRASLLFWWDKLTRTVRITGTVSRVSEVEAAAYFATRPRKSQLGAWASPQQSAVIDSRATLEQRFAEMEQRFEGREVDLPPFWGGYRLHAESLEFWQGQRSRLHDRLRYVRDAEAESGWRIERLSP